MNGSLLTLNNISLVNKSHIFRNDHAFYIKDISFSLSRNQSISIVGESASGKSTLMNAILKLRPYNTGTIHYKGKNIQDFSNRELVKYRRKIQPVFQNYSMALNPALTVRNNLVHGFSRKTKGNERRERLIELVNFIGLHENILHKTSRQLSGGEIQRLTIARALVTNPEIIILDEPFSALDVVNQENLIQLFQQIQNRYKVSYIFITHKIPLVKFFADAIFLIKSGKMKQIDSYQQLTSQYYG